MSTYMWLRDNPPRMRPYSKPRYQRDADSALSLLSEEQVVDLFRLDKEGLEYFSQKISSSPHVARKSKAGLSVKCQLLVALRYFASGSNIRGLLSVCNFNLCPSSVLNCVRNVSKALAELKDEFLSFPTDLDSVIATKEGFMAYGGFPACVGAIDGTQIKIKPPSSNEEVYVNRKGFHSINVQAICNHDLIFTDVVVKWPGSTHDTAIWNTCAVKKVIEEQLREGSWNGWLIGDSGYPQRPCLMIPLADPVTDEELNYNKALVKCRNTIERAFGVLKSRFRVLDRKSGGGIQYDIETAVNIIMACFVLHNYCRIRNFRTEIDADIADRIRQEQSLCRFQEPELIPENEDEAGEQLRGEEIRHRIIASFS